MHGIKKLPKALTWHFKKKKWKNNLERLRLARDDVQYHYVKEISAEGKESNVIVKRTDVGVRDLVQEKEQKERKKIETWLSPHLDFLAKQEELLDKCYPVGDWLLTSRHFQRWLGGPLSHLRLYGVAGSGKVCLHLFCLNYADETTSFPLDPQIRGRVSALL